ncbi:NADH:ubiquinone oxidoreductase 6.6kD subunit [Phyllosticta citribraziliensis]|uniref:NADH:ubiquinone oxidoreductase 6.6kD subunit n=2 Tax=Phyllosticta TaxID=121621 RepID=A0ABR1Y754_9PEZI
MAGGPNILHDDAAMQKIADIGPNRYKYFRWTPRTAWYSIAYAIVVPSVVGYLAYATEGKYYMRGKRRGDVIKEF